MILTEQKSDMGMLTIARPHTDTINSLRIKDRWENILFYKEVFLQKKGENPCRNPYIDTNVAKSWILSRENGVNPSSIKKISTLSRLKEKIKQNKYLIETTKSLINCFKNIFIESKYILYLIDREGLCLFMEGEWEKDNILSLSI